MSTEFTNQSLWSYPATHFNPVTHEYEHRGMIFMGYEKVTQKQLDQLVKDLGASSIDEIQIDPGTPMGRWHPDYCSYWESFNSPSSRMGGLGSQTYEHQKVKRGVEFAKEPGWYTSLDGELLKGIPGNAGERHMHYVGQDTYDWYEGPEPGSDAEKFLGDGTYAWNKKNSWYVVKKAVEGSDDEKADDIVICEACGQRTDHLAE